VVHCFVAVSMLQGGAIGKKIWGDQAVGRIFEKPGSGLKYLLTGPAWEVLSLLSYFLSNDPDSSMHVYAFQLFALGGGEMYNQLTFSDPQQSERHFIQILCIESVFMLGMLCDKRVELAFETCFMVYAGCKLLGYLWAGSVVYMLRKFGLGKFAIDQVAKAAREKAEKEAEEEEERERNKPTKPAAPSSSTSSSMASSSSDATHAKKD